MNKYFVLIILSAIGLASAAVADTPFTTFNFPVTGQSATRTMPNRLVDVHNVKDCGATGDGVTNDAPAIQACIDWNVATVTTTTSSAAGTNTITVSSVPSIVTTSGGFSVVDTSRPAVIPSGTTITNIAGNVLTLSNNITGNGVANGDTIVFSPYHRGEIFFPAGTYNVSTTGIKLESVLSIIMRGVGASTIITGSPSGSGTSCCYVIDRSPSYNPVQGPIVIEKMRVVSGNASTYGAIRVGSSINVAVRDLVVEGFRGLNLTQGTTVATATVNAGGSGYVAGEVITLTGGTANRQPKLTVTTVSAGAVTGVTITDNGDYTAFPSSTNTPTGVAQGSSTGSGTGATFNLFIGGASQSVVAENIAFGGFGNTAGSVGVIVGANGRVSAVDSTGGAYTGIAAFGVGVVIEANRLEVLETGIALGVNEIGYNMSLNGFSVISGSFESNCTAIDFLGGTGSGIVTGTLIHGFENANARCTGSDPQYGIRVRSDNAQRILFVGNTLGGQMAVASIAIANPAANRNYQTWMNNGVGNASTLGGVAWSMPTVASQAQWFNDSNPAALFTYANLPTGGNVTEGDEYMISDALAANCADGSCSTFATNVTGGGGALHRKVRWNGSNWTLVGR